MFKRGIFLFRKDFRYTDNTALEKCKLYCKDFDYYGLYPQCNKKTKQFLKQYLPDIKFIYITDLKNIMINYDVIFCNKLYEKCYIKQEKYFQLYNFYIYDDILLTPLETIYNKKSYYKKFSAYYNKVQNINIPYVSTNLIKENYWSPYINWGIISIRQLYTISNIKVRRELHFRDFFIKLMYLTNEFKDFYQKNFSWNYDISKEIWRAKTKVPTINAIVNCLKTTGFIDNRQRMIFASFVTKDKNYNWQYGEKLFKKYLLDYDLALNTGNWLWCASIGPVSQPKFRKFNPYKYNNLEFINIWNNN